MHMTPLARIALLASMFVGFIGTQPLAAQEGRPPAVPAEVVVASGTMDGRFLADALFHIGEFWMHVRPDTEFHRWMSQGLDRTVVIMVTNDTRRFADVRNVRILSGTLIRNMADAITPAVENVVGRLPEGDMAFVHELFLRDELSGILGPVTFETCDRVTASKFEAYVGKHIDMIIQIK